MNNEFEFDHTFNFDDNLYRSITIGVINEFYRKLRWNYTWNDKTTAVTVPFFYSLTGSDDFLTDAFIDNIVGRRPKGQIEQIPRGVIVLNSYAIQSKEKTNPNVNMVVYKEIDGMIKKVIGKFRIIPVKCKYSVVIKLDNENDINKCNLSLMRLFQQTSYQFFYVNSDSFRIDCLMSLPDNQDFEIGRDITLTSEDKHEIKFEIDVDSFIPIDPIQSPLIPVNNKFKTIKGRIWDMPYQKKEPKYIGVIKNIPFKDYNNPN
jgi:hypothetical protein